MKIATFGWAGRRHVGRLSVDGRDVIPLALGERAHAAGALVRVEANAPSEDLILDVPMLVSIISAGIPRFRGDIIATGTFSNPVQ